MRKLSNMLLHDSCFRIFFFHSFNLFFRCMTVGMQKYEELMKFGVDLECLSRVYELAEIICLVAIPPLLHFLTSSLLSVCVFLLLYFLKLPYNFMYVFRYTSGGFTRFRGMVTLIIIWFRRRVILDRFSAIFTKRLSFIQECSFTGQFCFVPTLYSFVEK